MARHEKEYYYSKQTKKGEWHLQSSRKAWHSNNLILKKLLLSTKIVIMCSKAELRICTFQELCWTQTPSTECRNGEMKKLSRKD